MNTNALKKFATAARRKLIAQVTAKLGYVLGSDSPALREQAASLTKLRDELTRTSKTDLIERVAYTWFNRFVALRFLDANDYQPTGIRSVSPSDGFTTPQLLDEAKNGQIDDSLPVNKQRVMDLLDGRLPSRDPQNEAYQLLLIATCNALNSALPFLFEPLADYTELLMPDDLLSPQSVLGDIREGITAEDCGHVEVIGWLYQFYISERKDAVFAAKSKVKAEDIPAATQLFTPRWVVEYMVQNTVGKLWLRNHPNSTLRDKMPYYLESPSESTDAFLPIARPQDISLLDPAAGSGHILVYGFELLVHIYEEEGYSRTEIPALILQHNLMGFDIDERAAQLAAFALSMKARQIDRRFLRRDVQPRVVALHKLTHTNETDWRSLLTEVGCTYLDPLVRDLTAMTQADNLGALIRPETPLDSLKITADAMTTFAHQSADLFQKLLAEDLAVSLQHLALLAQKHACVVANPPYMGGGAMNDVLGKFVTKHYPDSKADLMACFMESGLSQCLSEGYLGMINQHNWMFLGSYEALRKKLINNALFDTLLHLGIHMFPELNSKVVQNAAFTFQKHIYTEPLAGVYVRLVGLKNSAEKATNIRNASLTYHAKQDSFEKIPGEVIGYWLSSTMTNCFQSNNNISKFATPKKGMDSGNNDLFMRYWYEVRKDKLRVSSINKDIDQNWVPYTKGGEFRRWYGNNDFIINWSGNGKIIKEYSKSNIRNEKYFFKEGATWTLIGTNGFSVRYNPSGFIFDANGSSLFSEYNLNYLVGLLNSKVVSELLNIINPTLAFQTGNIANIPVIISHSNLVEDITNKNIAISREDWDARETSWDFKRSELLRHHWVGSLADAVEAYEAHWQGQFTQLHQNEEELNHIFIDLYGLQDELTPEVDPTDITILGQEAKPDSTGKLAFDRRELMAQFVSYAVGCMFGRYSLDKPGLILASQGQTLTDYAELTTGDESAPIHHSFAPDADNIIPVLDEDWFADDIVARFRAFVRAAFPGTDAERGPTEFNQNIAFIEECLGMDIRKWFTRYFYDDHIRRYRRRPIYWLFRSPKGSFSALVYLHRYTPATVSLLLNGYLRQYGEKLRNRREGLQTYSLSAGISAGEKNRATREVDRLEKVLNELVAYERDVIYPLATQPLAMDLDDGVLVNYNRFGAALAPVKGLTGKVGGGEDD